MLKKLTISPCSMDKQGNISVDASKQAFTVMLNPTQYTHTHKIVYNRVNTLGQLAKEQKFSSIDGETVTFNNIIIDGTGVVTPVVPADANVVKMQIELLKNVVYCYQGNIHQPNYVRLLWGSLIFFGRLDSMKVNYTLFKPSGDPLRAKVDMTFKGFMSKEEETLRANRSSPDLSHMVEFKAGDTLPLLCNRIYNDCSYYLDVARVNNIDNFRDIKPGTRLYFPPLR